jgi:ribonuclease P protein component
VISGYRLRRSAEFQLVRAERRGAADAVLRLQVRPNQLGHPRFGISISKRLGGAVERNLVRRRLRAAAASEASSIGGFDLVLIPQSAARTASFQDLAIALGRTLEKSGVRAAVGRAG